jgi:hypothetical protein
MVMIFTVKQIYYFNFGSEALSFGSSSNKALNSMLVGSKDSSNAARY